MNRSLPWLAAILLVAALWAMTPARLQFEANMLLPELPAAELIPGTEERTVKFAGMDHTEWAVVALHGFSATRQETAPLAETVARRLGANLFEARLSGHGLASLPMAGVLAEHWLRDGVRAIEAGAELGDKLIIIGTSTGATLAAALLDQPIASKIDTLVMISPNFEPRNTAAKWLTRPAGPVIARLTVGDTRCWQSRNLLQQKYWSTCYPTAAAVEMMRLVGLANRILPAPIAQRLLMFYSADDMVVASDASLAVFNATDAPEKRAIEIRDAGDPSRHVLAGDILSPNTTEILANAIVEFIERPAP